MSNPKKNQTDTFLNAKTRARAEGALKRMLTPPQVA
jgi:hypothetical protein